MPPTTVFTYICQSRLINRNARSGLLLSTKWSRLSRASSLPDISVSGTVTALRSSAKRGNISSISSASQCRRRLRGNSMTKCSSSTLTGAIQVRSGLQRKPSNHDLPRVSKRGTPGEGWDKFYAGNEGRRIQRLQGFEASGHSKAVSLGWTSSDKNHGGRGHATGTHHSVGGIPTSESAAGVRRRRSRRGRGGRRNSVFCRLTCDVYRSLRRFGERNLQ